MKDIINPLLKRRRGFFSFHHSVGCITHHGIRLLKMKQCTRRDTTPFRKGDYFADLGKMVARSILFSRTRRKGDHFRDVTKMVPMLVTNWNITRYDVLCTRYPIGPSIAAWTRRLNERFVIHLSPFITHHSSLFYRPRRMGRQIAVELG